MRSPTAPPVRTLVLAAVLAFAPPAFAQDATPDSACTYTTCALRLDASGPGLRLVRGGVPVAAPPAGPSLLSRLTGVVGPAPLPIAEAVASSPAALAHARVWKRDARIASGLRSGAVLALVTAYALGVSDVLSDGGRRGVVVGAVGLGAASVPFGVRSRRARDRAIETYNAGLER